MASSDAWSFIINGHDLFHAETNEYIRHATQSPWFFFRAAPAAAPQPPYSDKVSSPRRSTYEDTSPDLGRVANVVEPQAALPFTVVSTARQSYYGTFSDMCETTQRETQCPAKKKNHANGMSSESKSAHKADVDQD